MGHAFIKRYTLYTHPDPRRAVMASILILFGVILLVGFICYSIDPMFT
jgi:hypothetical protein